MDQMKEKQETKRPSLYRRFRRRVGNLLFKIPPIRWGIKFLRSLFRCGFRVTWLRTKQRYLDSKAMRRHRKTDYSRITEERRVLESGTAFPKDITFSILVPLYNTPLPFLDAMIGSVVSQTYGGWELCLCDGSDAQHSSVGTRVLEWAKKDARIRYQKLEKNLGISENTNACINMAKGNFIALFDHDDILHPSALYEMMRAICEQDADFIYTDEATFESPNIKRLITVHRKPDFAPDTLRANNYICHFSAFAREVLDRAGKFRPEFDGSQDHDMILRLTASATRVAHIPKLLYFWRSHPQSVAMDIHSKTYAIRAGQRAVQENIRAAGYEAEVESSRAFPTIYRIRYKLPEVLPKISILIPNKDHSKMLRKCLEAILEKTTYPDYEILIVDNGSTEAELLTYYDSLASESRVRILHYDRPFNYSAINNDAASEATGEYLVLLNNDVEIISSEWLEEMLMYAMREDVGAVGAMLYYPNETIQHAGVVLGLGADRIAGHVAHRVERGSVGYMGRLCYAQNYSVVTAACLMVRKAVYVSVGGLDESYPVAFNDVDFCLRLREKGLLNVWTPYAEAYHYESLTRGKDHDDAERAKRFAADCARFRERWNAVLAAGDPYYNPNFSLDNSFALADYS